MSLCRPVVESTEPLSPLKKRGKATHGHLRTFFFFLKHLVVLMWEIKLQGPHDKLARCPSATLVCELPYKIKPLGRTEQSQNF